MFSEAFIALLKQFGVVGGLLVTFVIFMLYQSKSQEAEISKLHSNLQAEMQSKIDSLGMVVGRQQIQINLCQNKYDSLLIVVNKNTITNIQLLIDKAFEKRQKM